MTAGGHGPRVAAPTHVIPPCRIVVTAPSAYALGGVASWLDDLSRALTESGAHVIAALPDSAHHDVTAYIRAFPDLEVARLANRTGSHEGRIRSILRMLKNVQPTIVLGANMPDTYAAVNRYRMDSREPVHVALTAHGFLPGAIEDVKAWRGVLDGTISLNRLLRAMMVTTTGIEEARSYYAPGGVTVPDALAPKDAGPCLRLAWVGRVSHDEKRALDIKPLLRRLDQLQVPYRLRIAGSGPDEAALRAMLLPWEEAGKVVWMRHVPRGAMLKAVWSETDVLVITSASEAGPLVAWEAMAHGVAVVSSRYLGHGCEGALRDHVTCLLFRVGDMDAAAACVQKLQSQALRRQLVQAGRDVVMKRYSWPVFREAWVQALTAILSRHPRPAVRGSVPRVKPQGRLDRWLGTAPAETLRVILRRRHNHESAGAEWPHVGPASGDTEAYLRLAQEMDLRCVAQARHHES